VKRKLEIAAFLLLAALCAVAWLFFGGGKEQALDSDSGLEVSIRNATRSRISYWIKPNNTFDPPEEKTIKPGDVHHYRSWYALELSYDRLGVRTIRYLTPGKPYAFRYDENNLIKVYEGSHGRDDAEDLAPFVATPMEVVAKMLEVAGVDSQDTLYDIGCGDGRIVVMAAQKYGARGVGIDIDPRRIEESRENARAAGVEHLVNFYIGDAMKMNFSTATVVALYLLPESNALLRPLFEKQLKPGVRIVTHNYSIPGWEDRLVETFYLEDESGNEHSVYLYRK